MIIIFMNKKYNWIKRHLFSHLYRKQHLSEENGADFHISREKRIICRKDQKSEENVSTFHISKEKKYKYERNVSYFYISK